MLGTTDPPSYIGDKVVCAIRQMLAGILGTPVAISAPVTVQDTGKFGLSSSYISDPGPISSCRNLSSTIASVPNIEYLVTFINIVNQKMMRVQVTSQGICARNIVMFCLADDKMKVGACKTIEMAKSRCFHAYDT